MNEVEKMYENAGIRPNYIDACTVEDKYWQNEELANKYGTFDMYMNAKCGHQEDCTTLCSCAYTKEEYPPFTAEKQIYIIKFLSDKTEYLGIHYDRYKGLFEMQTDIGGLSIKNEFEEALASRVNVLWQDLTEEERKQIKEILE